MVVPFIFKSKTLKPSQPWASKSSILNKFKNDIAILKSTLLVAQAVKELENFPWAQSKRWEPRKTLSVETVVIEA